MSGFILIMIIAAIVGLGVVLNFTSKKGLYIYELVWGIILVVLSVILLCVWLVSGSYVTIMMSSSHQSSGSPYYSMSELMPVFFYLIVIMAALGIFLICFGSMKLNRLAKAAAAVPQAVSFPQPSPITAPAGRALPLQQPAAGISEPQPELTAPAAVQQQSVTEQTAVKEEALQTTPVAAPLSSVPAYFIVENNQAAGPFEEPVLRQLAEQGRITRKTYVWREGMQDWAFAENVDDFASILPPEDIMKPGVML